MESRTNAGFIITDSIHIGNSEFVIGIHTSAPRSYVTWQCRNGNDYFWGHYFEDRQSAERDLLERAGQELEFETEKQASKAKSRERER